MNRLSAKTLRRFFYVCPNDHDTAQDISSCIIFDRAHLRIKCKKSAFRKAPSLRQQ